MEQVIKVCMSFPGISYFKELLSANTRMVLFFMLHWICRDGGKRSRSCSRTVKKKALGLTNECYFLSLTHSYVNCMKCFPVHEKDLVLWGNIISTKPLK